MEQMIEIQIERLKEGVYLATSNEIQGLVAQGRTVTETLEIARDIARKLIEAQKERKNSYKPSPIPESFNYPLILSS